ncbi:MAG: hypothetical protein ABI321_17745 [Polyangia bacterium]
MKTGRRHVLRLMAQGPLWLLVAARTGRLLGRARPARIVRRRADDLAPIPWIGHC